MGGKALKKYGINTERKSTEDFLKIGNEIQNKIENDLYFDTYVVKCYTTKQSHGDLDLLIKISNNSNIDWKKYINHTFKPKIIHYNGGVYSFDYKKFQIDFIIIKESKWEIAKTYYNWDPLGNIMGKTYHKFNLSYGWNGLYYKFRNFNGRVSDNILICNNPHKIFKFGDYDYDRYLQGFDKIEEIFEFVQKSKYFDNKIFKFENLNHIDKKRNRKRNSYHLFLKYLEDNNVNQNYEFHKDKESYLPMINDFFPEADLMNKINELKHIDKENKILSQKFNGDMVMSWIPNLMGKELGQAITKFKNALGNDYREFILNGQYKDIYNRFMEIYENN